MDRLIAAYDILFTPERAVVLAMLLPFIAALILPFTSKRPNLREGVSLVFAVLTALVVFGKILPSVLAGGRPEVDGIEMMPGLAINFWVEPLGMIFAGVASLLWPIATLYSAGYMRGNNEKKQTGFAVWFAISIGSALGIAFSGNLLTLFVFYEVLTLATYPLVTHKGNADAKAGGRTYLGILMCTSIFFLMFAVIATWVLSGNTDFATGYYLGTMLPDDLSPLVVGLLLFLFMYGIGKAALMPIHPWLPAAMVAPTPVSALLHAVAVVKAGVFCVVKVIVYVFGWERLQATMADDWLVYVAGLSIVIASLIAMRQDNLKKRLAYSTVSQLSYVTMAAAIMSPLAIMGAALHIVAHAFGKITLFFAAGSIYTASHKTNVSQLDGIGRKMPWTMGAFAIGAMSMIGLPPAVGFVSKWYMLQGGLDMANYFAIGVIFVSTLLNAAYFMPIIYAAFFKPHVPDPAHPEWDTHGEANPAIVIAISTTALLTVLTFLFPDVPLALARSLVGV